MKIKHSVVAIRKNVDDFCAFLFLGIITMTVLVDGEQETEPELNCLAKYKETNNTSNPCLDVFFFFSRLISFWFRFLLTINMYRLYLWKAKDIIGSVAIQ